MKQKLIIESSAEAFDIEVNSLLAEEWYFVPGTFIANMSADGKTERFTMLLVQDEEHDEMVAYVKHQMALDGGNAGGCACQGHENHGPFPPPFFKPPGEEDEPPSPSDCNPILS